MNFSRGHSKGTFIFICLDLSKVKSTKADEPLKSILERARFLADQKLLKNPDPPKVEKKR